VVQIALYTVIALMWKIPIFYAYGLYRHEWRYASIEEWIILAKGILATWGAGIILFFFVLRPTGILSPDFPRSIAVIDGLLAAIFVSGLRFSVCFGFYLSVTGRREGVNRRVLIAGAGVAGSMIVQEMRTNPQLHLEPVGFVDDDPEKFGQYIHGIRVLGTLQDIPMIVLDYQIDEVIIAMPTAPGRVNRAVVQACKASNVSSKTVPGIFEILGGRAKVSEIRDVQIEDLLRRGVVQHEIEGVAPLLAGKRVMVTGAGGSIGSELSRQICGFKPAELTLLGHGENSIFQIAAELRRQNAGENGSVNIHTIIADIRDRERMTHVFQSYKPQLIFHAAAHKHVGLMEGNLPDAVTNNVLGTKILVDLADEFGVDRFILISSDKAVNPLCIMGVTKRVAELIVDDAALRTGRAFVTVRFGNVLGSRGSVVPIFKQQIAQGGPLYVTDPNVKRYFMTIPEAVQLVLQSAYIGEGGEVFVLNMGEPIKIIDLARDLIRLSGLEEGKDIDIVFTGLQSGEKLSEELFFASEMKESSVHEKIFVCRNGHKGTTSVQEGNEASRTEPIRVTLRANVQRLIRAAQQGRVLEAKHMLRKIVPEYQFTDERSEHTAGISFPKVNEAALVAESVEQ
jgi:FlaA1/EpsC-like NDP-sugar epimerase